MANVPRLIDPYELQSALSGEPACLSADGTGSTHRATDTRSGQPVILRIFSQRLLGDSAIQKDFVNHAKLLIELDHPGVTRIVDTGQHGDQFFYVLQDPGGQTVEEMVAASGPFEVPQALRLHLQLSEALLAVRTQPGLLSRVWPRNLMVTGQELDAKIMLIAQNLIGPVDPEEQPEYLAPEILAGHADSVQATLYSIGATLYYMLTGKSPYPANLRMEDLLEAKSKGSPDMSLLPQAAPITLLKHLLEADPRNRPKSLMEWDRALQRFIRFTPTETSPVAVQEMESATRDARESATPAATPFGTPASAAPVEEVTSRVDAAPEELQKAKVHTQRLSVELTKRVQKELALTEQLKQLETDLEKERARAKELTSKRAKQSDAAESRLKEERRRLEADKKALERERRSLDKDKKKFLEETQKFSLAQLKAESRALKDADPNRTKPQFFRFNRRPKKAVEPTPAKETEKMTAPDRPVNAVAVEPQGEAAEPSAKPQPQPSPKPTESKRPKVATPQAKVSVTAKPDPAAPPKPVRQQAPPARQPKVAPKPTQKPQLQGKPAVTRKESSKSATPDRVVVPPTYQPLPGAWYALGLLAAVIVIGLFFVYRTFFQPQENHYLEAAIHGDPIVVDANRTPDEATMDEEGVVDRESQVNEEIRVNMRVMENVRLLDDEEWEELLYGMRNLEHQNRYSEQELFRIRRELFEGLERKARLKQDEMASNAGYRELYQHLKPYMDAIASEGDLDTTETVESESVNDAEGDS